MYFASCNNIDEDLRVKPEDDFLENFEDDILEKFEDNFLNELVEFCVSDCSCAERMRWRPRGQRVDNLKIACAIFLTVSN
jgi:hypothetical protein